MNEINSVVLSNYSGVTQKSNKNVNFRASYASSSDMDSFVKEQEKAKKAAKRKENVYYGFLGILAAGTLASVGIALYQFKGMGQSKHELEKMWGDLSKSAKVEDLALPEDLRNFVERFKKSASNSDILKRRGGRPVKSLLLYGPPGTGKTTFAQALAKEFPDSKFAFLDVTNLGSEYQSVSERNLNKAVDMICKEADKNPKKKIFVFIDEIDSVMMVDNSLSAKHSNDMLNEFKKCFTEKLGKRENIITIGATNLSIDVEKGIALGGKKLDGPMLDRFSQKILVDKPTKEQIVNSVKFHYKDSDLVCDALKTDSKELNVLAEFLSKSENNASFRTLESIYEDAANSILDETSKVEVKDVVKTIARKKHELKYNDAEFVKMLADLNINTL